VSRRMLAGWIAAVALGNAGGAMAAGSSCDVKCLQGVMDRYLAQLIKHDARPLAVAGDLVAVENAQPVKLGEGSWATVKSYPVSGQTFADPVTGQVVHYTATTGADAKIGSLFVRLKVVNRKIAESEIFSRGAYTAEGQETAGLLEPDVLYPALVPEPRRSSREQLMKVVGLYTDGISQHSGAVFPAGGRCDRYQAGNKFTNVQATLDRGGGTCQTSMDHLKGEEVVNRRIAVVDTARGIVAVLFVIPHGERTPKGATNVAEVFKIVDGKVRSIEEFSFVGGWPPASGFPDQRP
jgi:hypothetical protein